MHISKGAEKQFVDVRGFNNYFKWLCYKENTVEKMSELRIGWPPKSVEMMRD